MSQYSESTKRALLSIPLVGVLAALGKRTDRLSSHGLFFSPLREEKHPSFQINERDNIWVDWGTGERGGVLDLICRIRGCSRFEAMDFLAGLEHQALRQGDIIPSSCAQNTAVGESQVIIDSCEELRSASLLRYGTSRGISEEILKRFCREVHFHFLRSGKNIYSIGFKNNRGGYVLRNALNGAAGKLCTRPSGITTFDRNLDPSVIPLSESVVVVEGFMDFLSLLEMNQCHGSDVCVLNSGVNIPSAIDYLSMHKTVYAMLDNDSAGDKYTCRIHDSIPPHIAVIDCRSDYSDYNDLNDLLLGSTGVRKPSCHQKAQEYR